MAHKFNKYKPIKVNGVFIPELALSSVSIPSNQSLSSSSHSTPNLANPQPAIQSKEGASDSIQKIIESMHHKQDRIKVMFGMIIVTKDEYRAFQEI